jgi:hypothetical protein
VSSASRDGETSAAFGCPRAADIVRGMNTATASDRTAGTTKDRCHPLPSRIRLEASPLATIATPIPDQTSDPAAERLSGSVASKTMRKIENTPKPAASPATKRPAAIIVMSDVSPQTSIAQAKTKWLARQSADAPTFASSVKATPRTEQVADEVKRSEQPGGGQAKLQVAREGREHDPVSDARNADVQADREHRDGQQAE